MALSYIIIILVAHFIADFLFQNKWIATNKSSNNFHLFVHITTYGFILSTIMYICIEWLNFVSALQFGIISAILHFAVDYFTSKITSWQYKNGYTGSNSIPNIGVFSTIGIDQLIHHIMLFVIFKYMFLS